MKYLKYIGFGILALLAIFFIRGLLTPSIYYESEVVVDKSAAESWAFMSDEANLTDWIEGIDRLELISGEANTVGAVSNIYMDEASGGGMMKETVTKVVPNKHLAMDFTMDFMDMEYEMLLDEKVGKTTISSKSTTKGNSLFAKSLISFMKGGMKKQEDKNMVKLKDLINANTKDYFETPAEDLKEVGAEDPSE